MLGSAVLLAATLTAAPPAAVITSVKSDRVALTIYRAPGRTVKQAMNLHWLGGFALVTETRTIDLPAGDAVLRFEGVADGIVPASAIVTGLPGGVIEKNRDARLLSPAALIDGTLGRFVMIRRTDSASGSTHEEQAKIIAGPSQGVVLQTESGIETLGCSGLGEIVRYDGVPAGLSAHPTLSVITHSPQPVHATISLSYLADGFDWSASYVATVAPGGGSLALSAWLTVANNNTETFQDVDLQAVAGRLQRGYAPGIAAAAAKLQLHCYPMGTTTSDLPTTSSYRRQPGIDDIVVTAMRMMAPAPSPPLPAEDLGDLKLYRVPETVTIAANGQKQVALLARQHVAYERVYRVRLHTWDTAVNSPPEIVLRLRNDEKAGLGIPLPAGTTTLYQSRDGTKLLLGLGTIGDTAKGEHARFIAGISPQLRVEQSGVGRKRSITLSNANPYPAQVEVALGSAGDALFVDTSAPLERITGIQTWRLILPANGKAEFYYKVPDQ